MNQKELWEQVTATKRRVILTIGATANLGHDFRSTPIYQAYTGLCGEAKMAYDDGELTDELVAMLDEQADKVIAHWRQQAS